VLATLVQLLRAGRNLLRQSMPDKLGGHATPHLAGH
jgi:hypothetical protein